METRIRCTVGQAIVRYLDAQHSDYDGQRRRLVPAIFGIFGHGNVVGLGQGLEEEGDRADYLQEQRAVDGPCRRRLSPRRARRHAGLYGVDRSGLYQHGHGCSRGDDQSTPGVAVPLGLLRARAVKGPLLQQLDHPLPADVSVNDCFRAVTGFFDRISRPEQLLTALPEAIRVLPTRARRARSPWPCTRTCRPMRIHFPTPCSRSEPCGSNRRPPGSDEQRGGRGVR